MTERERFVFTAFLQQERIDFRWLNTEVPILPLTAGGEQLRPGSDWTWDFHCALKADALVMLGSELVLIEVEETVSYQAVGQLLVYAALWDKANPATRIQQLWLVAAYTDERIAPALDRFAIQLRLVNRLPGELQQPKAGATDNPGGPPRDQTARTKGPGTETAQTCKEPRENN